MSLPVFLSLLRLSLIKYLVCQNPRLLVPGSPCTVTHTFHPIWLRIVRETFPFLNIWFRKHIGACLCKTDQYDFWPGSLNQCTLHFMSAWRKQKSVNKMSATKKKCLLIFSLSLALSIKIYVYIYSNWVEGDSSMQTTHQSKPINLTQPGVAASYKLLKICMGQ